MRLLATFAAFGLCLTVSTTARADPSEISGTVGGGFDVGINRHASEDGFKAALVFDAEVRYRFLALGVAVSFDAYGEPVTDVPGGARTEAVRLGVRHILTERVTGAGRVYLAGVAALELGVHRYDAEGRTSSFLGPTTTTTSDSRAVGFFGGRAGLTLGLAGTGGVGVEMRGELVGRRDRNEVTLQYAGESCGGLFTSGCSDISGTAEMGGSELTFLYTIAVRFGH